MSQYRRAVHEERNTQSTHDAAAPLRGVRRILLYGVTGSGKTRAAERIGAATGIPWTAVDDLAWEPDWVQAAGHEQRRRFEEICAGDSWVLDSACGTWSDVVLGGDSIIRWHFRSFRSKHDRIVAWEVDPQIPRVRRSTRPSDSDHWIDTLRIDETTKTEEAR